MERIMKKYYPVIVKRISVGFIALMMTVIVSLLMPGAVRADEESMEYDEGYGTEAFEVLPGEAQYDMEIVLSDANAFAPTLRYYTGGAGDEHKGEDLASLGKENRLPVNVKKVNPLDGRISENEEENTAYGIFLDSTVDFELLTEPVGFTFKPGDPMVKSIMYHDYSGLSSYRSGDPEKVFLDEDTFEAYGSLYERRPYTGCIEEGYNTNTAVFFISAERLAEIMEKHRAKDKTKMPAKLFIVMEDAVRDNFRLSGISSDKGLNLAPQSELLLKADMEADYVRVMAGEAGEDPLLGKTVEEAFHELDISKLSVYGIITDIYGNETARKEAFSAADPQIEEISLDDEWEDVNWITYDTDPPGRIRIDESALKTAYRYQRGISLYIDSSSAPPKERFFVMGEPNPYVEWYRGDKALAGNILPGENEEYPEEYKAVSGEPYKIYVKGAEGYTTPQGEGRKLRSVSYTTGGERTMVIDSFNEEGFCFEIPGEKVRGDITLSAVADEPVTLLKTLDSKGNEVTGKAAVYNADGTPGERAETGKEYSFLVYAGDGYMVRSVKTRTGEGEEEEALYDENTGLYKTKSIVDDALFISLVLEKAEQSFEVRTLNGAQDERVTVRALNGQSRDSGADVIGCGSLGLKISPGQDLCFLALAAPGYLVKKVTYSMASGRGGALREDLKPVILNSGEGIYKIPGVTGDVVISVETEEVITVRLPSNRDVMITLNDDTKEYTGETVEVPLSQNFSFKITPRSENITVKDILYYPGVTVSNPNSPPDKETSFLLDTKPLTYLEASEELSKNHDRVLDVFNIVKIGSGSKIQTINIPVAGKSTALLSSMDLFWKEGEGRLDPETCQVSYSFLQTGLSLYVETEEVIKAPYKAVFQVSGEDFSSAGENKFIESTFTGREKNVNTLKSQKMLLCPGESTGPLNGGDFSVTFYTSCDPLTKTYKDGVTDASKNCAVTYSVGKTAQNDRTVKINEDTSLTGCAPGRDVIRAELIYQDMEQKTGSGEGMKRIYTAELPVETVEKYDDFSIETVKDRTSGMKTDGADIEGFFAGDEIYLEVFGKDGRTKASSGLEISGAGETSRDVKKIEWSFDPDIASKTLKNHYFQEGEDKLGYKAISGENKAKGAGSVTLKADVKEDMPVKVVAKVTLGNGETRTLSRQFYIVGPKGKAGGYVVTAGISMEGTEYRMLTDNIPGDKEGGTALYLNSESLNRAVVEYNVYSITKEGASYIEKLDPGNFSSPGRSYRASLNSKKKINDEIRAGHLISVRDVEFEDRFGNYTKDFLPSDSEVSYAGFSGSDGLYEVRANRVSTSSFPAIVPVIRIDHVDITKMDKEVIIPSVLFTISKNAPLHNVDLYTRDIVSKSGTDSLKEKDYYRNELKATYAGTGEITCLIDEEGEKNRDPDLDEYLGISFPAVEEGKAFVLPKEDDFKKVLSGRTLTGWQVLDPYTGEIKGYKNPGDVVTVTFDMSFCPVWRDRYVEVTPGHLISFMNGNIFKEKGRTEYEGGPVLKDDKEGELTETAYPVEAEGDTFAAGGKIPVKIKMTEVVGISPEALEQAGELGVPGILGKENKNFLYKTVYYDGSEKGGALKLSDPAATGTVTLNKNLVSIDSSSGGADVKLRASLTDPVSGDIYEETMETGFKTVAKPAWELEIRAKASEAEAGTLPVKIEVSRFKIGGENLLDESATLCGKLNGEGLSYDPYTLEWSVDGTEGGNKYASIKSEKTTEEEAGTYQIRRAGEASLTPLLSKKVTVSLRLRDKDGNYADASTEIMIKNPLYSIVVEDEYGNEITDDNPLLVGADRQADYLATRYRVKAVLTADPGKAGRSGGYFFAASEAGDRVLLPKQEDFIAGEDNYQIGAALTRDPYEEGNGLSEGWLTVMWVNREEVTYVKRVPVKNYYAITLNGIKGTGEGNLPEKGSYYHVTDREGNILSDGEYDCLPGTLIITDIFEEEDELTGGRIYTGIPLTDFGAVYVNSAGQRDDSLSLYGWNKSSSLDGEIYRRVIDRLEQSEFSDKGNLDLYADMITTPAKVKGYPLSTLFISNEEGKTDHKSIELEVIPASSSEDIRISAEDEGILGIFTGDEAYDALNGEKFTENGIYSLENASKNGFRDDGKGIIASNNKEAVSSGSASKRTDIFTIGALKGAAGATTVNIYGVPEGRTLSERDRDIEPLASFDLVITGFNENRDGTVSYVKEDGSFARNEALLEDGVIRYYDGDGIRIEDEGIVAVNDKYILVKNGTRALKGLTGIKGNMYAAGTEGEILCGWLDENFDPTDKGVRGKYYADPKKGGILADGFYKTGDDHYVFEDYVKQAAPLDCEGYVLEPGSKKYIDSEGRVAIGEYIQVNGKGYVVDETGALVTRSHRSVKLDGEGNFTYENKDGTVFVIAEDDTASEADKYCISEAPEFIWEEEFVYSEGKKPSVRVSYTLFSRNKNSLLEPLTVNAKVDSGVISDDKKSIVFTASIDLSSYYADRDFSTEAGSVSDERAYDINGVTKTYVLKSHEWGDWVYDKEKKTALVPLTLVYSVTKGEVQLPDEEVKADVTAKALKDKDEKGCMEFRAVYTALDGTVLESDIKTIDVDKGIVKQGGIALEGLKKEYTFVNAPIRPFVTVKDNDRGVVLSLGKDYSLSYKSNKKVSDKNSEASKKPSVTVIGRGNYTGRAVTAFFDIKAPEVLKDDLVSSVRSIRSIEPACFEFNGREHYPKVIEVVTKDDGIIRMTGDGKGGFSPLKEGSKTVAISIENNVNRGNAVVAATGRDNKTKTKTFKIKAADLSAPGILMEVTAEPCVYSGKALTPELKVTLTDPCLGVKTELIQGQDYTASYKNNKNAGENTASITITGKGNYMRRTSKKAYFTIRRFDLKDSEIVTNAAEGVKVKAIKTFVFKDRTLVPLPKKAYSISIEKEGEPLPENRVLKSGEEITVRITAADIYNVVGEKSLTITTGKDIGKTGKVSLTENFSPVYSGEAIELDRLEKDPFENDLIAVVMTAKGYFMKYGEDYEVAGYADNVRKGKMYVYLKGRGSFSGILTGRVRISPKLMEKAD